MRYRVAMLDDPQIRVALRRRFRRSQASSREAIIVEELGLLHGETRLDLAVIRNNIHGYEIKSDRDTLRRFSEQARRFNAVVDYLTVVTGWRHSLELMRSAPDWYGILVAAPGPRGGVRFTLLRVPGRNPCLDPTAVAALLWKEEAIAVLGSLGAATGIRSKPRAEIYCRLAEVIPDPSVLTSTVCHVLRQRIVSRVAAQPS